MPYFENDSSDRPLPDDEEPDDDYDYCDDDEAELVDCPSCGAALYEDAERCPVCGDYVTHGTSPWAGKPAWWIVLGLAGILAVVFALALA